jgi:tripartite-type tricarboxylate transporter receptor subunit TctC
MKVRALLLAILAAPGVTYAADAAQDYPRRPIRLLMPIGPGSANDTLGRIVAAKMGQIFNQQIVVDNRAGAGGLVGMEVGANAAPDGYTLIAGSAAAMSIVPHLHKKVPYDPVNGYEHVGKFAETPNILITNVNLPVRTVRELIDYANSRNGNINMASAGIGSQSHLTGVMFMTAAKMKSFHVPYKGGGGTVAVRANESQWQLPPAPSVMGLIRSGQVKALGHTMPKRSALLPDIPPIAETLPGFSYSGWNGLLAPRKTPAAIVRKVHDTMVQAVNSPEVRREFDQQVAEIDLTDGPAFKAFVAKEIKENAKLVEAAGLKPE